MTSTDQAGQLADALRLRIADPGAHVPRLMQPDKTPAETKANWRARAVAAGLADGSLGVNICSALCRDVERERDDFQDQLGDLRASLSAAEAEVDRLRHALVFNAITRALPLDRFVSLPERMACADAVLAALDDAAPSHS